MFSTSQAQKQLDNYLINSIVFVTVRHVTSLFHDKLKVIPQSKLFAKNPGPSQFLKIDCCMVKETWCFLSMCLVLFSPDAVFFPQQSGQSCCSDLVTARNYSSQKHLHRFPAAKHLTAIRCNLTLNCSSHIPGRHTIKGSSLQQNRDSPMLTLHSEDRVR